MTGVKVFVTIVVEPTSKTGYETDVRDRFYIEGGTASTQEICENVQVETYNLVEKLVEEIRGRSA